MNNLSSLIEQKRVILCVGCGGVGKTTTAAALGLAAAMRGKKVLCLTIDPARRLSQSLGISEMKTEAQTIPQEVFERSNISISGSLTVMMLDTKSTFDSLVAQLAPTPQKRDQILNNVLYKYISTSLAGTQEYMAMEKLYAVKHDPHYDLILLDTPPTPNALDFLDAPERLVGAIDSEAIRWFLQAFEGSGKFSMNLLAKSAAAILRGIGNLTGSGFLQQIAEFISEMNSLFGGWRIRANEVSTALRGRDVAYVLVTTPDPMSVREVMFFAERLTSQNMQADGFVVNRVHPRFTAIHDTKAIAQEAALHGIVDDIAPRLLQAAIDESDLGKQDALHLELFQDRVSEPAYAKCVFAYVPAFPYDIHDVGRLSQVAAILAP